ncbi:MAG: hypothetical protein ACKVRN_10035 [Pyrinomonadaceae bacterium]
MPKTEEYIEGLEDIVRKMMNPLKNIRFDVVIKALTGFDVLEFNRKDAIHQRLLANICTAADDAAEKVLADGGIKKARPNEVGNAIEAFIKTGLINVGYKDVDTPSGKSGKKKSQGYPDIEFTAEGNAVYLEVKSYGVGKGGGSMRSFYFSPSDDFKVSKNALHLLIAFEITRKADASFVTGWKIITVDNLLVDVKYEFNSNNPRLYTEHSVLAERKINLDL